MKYFYLLPQKVAVLGILAAALIACSTSEKLEPVFFPIQYVDPLIGTGAANTPSALLHSHAGNGPEAKLSLR